MGEIKRLINEIESFFKFKRVIARTTIIQWD